jgi:protein gp37
VSVAHSKIEWTASTWNPSFGCDKISPGCKFCYAEHPVATRLRRPFSFGLRPKDLAEPLHWRKPRLVFVDSLSDLFHERMPAQYIELVYEVMKKADWHVYQILTKRAWAMKNLMNYCYTPPFAPTFPDVPYWAKGETFSDFCGVKDPDKHYYSRLKHVWHGVSVEDRKWGLPRIKCLQETNCAHRFLSIEPLLEDLGTLDLAGVEWVIIGGESGQKARPCDIGWIYPILRQCREAGVPVFVKQLGNNPVFGTARDAGSKLNWKGDNIEEFPEDLRIREFPKEMEVLRAALDGQDADVHVHPAPVPSGDEAASADSERFSDVHAHSDISKPEAEGGQWGGR